MTVNEHGAAMFAEDRGSRTLGIELLATGDGRATARLAITEEMLNGLDLCHGGFIFALADTALAFAANSNGEGSPTVEATIAYSHPARAGDVLTARATIVDTQGRDATIVVDVANEAGREVATLRGRSRRPG